MVLSKHGLRVVRYVSYVKTLKTLETHDNTVEIGETIGRTLLVGLSLSQHGDLSVFHTKALNLECSSSKPGSNSLELLTGRNCGHLHKIASISRRALAFGWQIVLKKGPRASFGICASDPFA